MQHLINFFLISQSLSFSALFLQLTLIIYFFSTSNKLAILIEPSFYFSVYTLIILILSFSEHSPDEPLPHSNLYLNSFGYCLYTNYLLQVSLSSQYLPFPLSFPLPILFFPHVHYLCYTILNTYLSTPFPSPMFLYHFVHYSFGCHILCPFHILVAYFSSTNPLYHSDHIPSWLTTHLFIFLKRSFSRLHFSQALCFILSPL